MEGTRLRILQILQKKNADTVEGLATSLGLAPATIRRHLDILQRDRLVEFEQVRKKTGRPEYSFYLTEAGQDALPKNYDQMLGHLVQELSQLSQEDTRDKDGKELLTLLLTRLADGVSATYQPQLSDKPADVRLGVLVDHLRREDFSPEAELGEGQVRIKLLNCPFRSVALQHKEICTFDLGLVANFLGVDVSREQCIHDGDSVCAYTAQVDARPTEALVAGSS